MYPRSKKALNQSMLMGLRKLQQFNNKAGGHKKKLPLLAYKGKLRPTLYQNTLNFAARIPQYMYAIKRGGPDALRAAHALGMMKGIILTEIHYEGRFTKRRPLGGASNRS